jgi:cellulose biosynthesis protein BcsQ
MNKKIVFFNHKGGVSKTTTAFNLGWKIAEKGYKVLLVDADPQCNLTSLVGIMLIIPPKSSTSRPELSPSRTCALLVAHA